MGTFANLASGKATAKAAVEQRAKVGELGPVMETATGARIAAWRHKEKGTLKVQVGFSVIPLDPFCQIASSAAVECFTASAVGASWLTTEQADAIETAHAKLAAKLAAQRAADRAVVESAVIAGTSAGARTRDERQAARNKANGSTATQQFTLVAGDDLATL